MPFKAHLTAASPPLSENRAYGPLNFGAVWGDDENALGCVFFKDVEYALSLYENKDSVTTDLCAEENEWSVIKDYKVIVPFEFL